MAGFWGLSNLWYMIHTGYTPAHASSPLELLAPPNNLLNHQQWPTRTPRRLPHRPTLPQRLLRWIDKRRMLLPTTSAKRSVVLFEEPNERIPIHPLHPPKSTANKLLFRIFFCRLHLPPPAIARTPPTTCSFQANANAVLNNAFFKCDEDGSHQLLPPRPPPPIPIPTNGRWGYQVLDVWEPRWVTREDVAMMLGSRSH